MPFEVHPFAAHALFELAYRLFARLDQELVARSCGVGRWVVPHVEAEEVEAFREVRYPGSPISMSSCASAIWANTAFICIPMSTTRPIA